MSPKKNKVRDFISSSEELKEFKSISFKELINGRILTRVGLAKQLPFFLYLTLLAFVYIGNHYKVEKYLKEVAVLNKELKELRIEAITTSSDLMYMSKQSEVARRVDKAGLELKSLRVPPRKIVVRKEEE